jgi:type I restriction enzyme, S subunit
VTWPHVQLKDIFDIARGGSPRPIEKYLTEDDDGLNWILISDATESSKYILRTKRRIDRSGLSKSRLVKEGDLLLTNSMSFGRPYIMGTSGCIHDGWLVLSPKKPISPDFFYHILGSKDVYAKFAQLAGGATVKNLNIDLVEGVEVALPPLNEQRRIAAILDQVEALRRKRQEALERLNHLPSAILEEFLDDKNTVTVQRLDELIRRGDRINYGVVQPGPEEEQGIPLIRVENVVDEDFSRPNLKQISPQIEAKYSRSRLQGDEILVACVGSIGAVALAQPDQRGFNIARAVSRIPIDPLKADRIFVAEYLRRPKTQHYFKSETRTVAQPTLNIKQLCETRLPVPPLSVQRMFAGRVVAIDKLKAHHRAHLAKLDALFASLQHRAFRGEL